MSRLAFVMTTLRKEKNNPSLQLSRGQNEGNSLEVFSEIEIRLSYSHPT